VSCGVGRLGIEPRTY